VFVFAGFCRIIAKNCKNVGQKWGKFLHISKKSSIFAPVFEIKPYRDGKSNAKIEDYKEHRHYPAALSSKRWPQV
jgi:hypothetical protein